MAVRFLVPSLVWHGLEPALPGPTLLAGTDPLSKWGGQLKDEDAARALLLTLDSAVLVLNLAGYQVRAVVAGIPTAAKQTPATDLVAVDLATMRIQRGTPLEWIDPDQSRADAQVGLWVEPRYPSVRPGLSGVTLDLSTLQTPLEDQGIDLLFWDDGTGWLRFSWAAGPGSWLDELPGRADRFVEVTRAELAQLYAAAPPAESGLTVAGLLSLYDPATWSVANAVDLPSALAAFGERVRGVVLDGGEPGLAAFLTAELPLRTDAGALVFGGSRPPTAQDRFTDPDARKDLDAGLDEVADRALAANPGTATFPVDAYSDVTALSLTSLLMRWQEQGVIDVLTMIAPDEDRYGGYDLQVDDVDLGAVVGGRPAAVPVYGGLARSTDAGDGLPPIGTIGHVAQLRRDLAELGFGPAFSYLAGEATAQVFTIELELAVREFQIAAAYPNLAWQGVFGQPRFYADTLSQVVNEWPYDGPVSGVVNADTRTLIGTWLDRKLRCPIVVEARTGTGFTDPYPGADSDNLWRADQVGVSVPRMYVRDLSGRFVLEPDSVAAGRGLDKVVLGEWTSLTDDRGRVWTGPVAMPPNHVWAEREILPESLIGAAFTTLPLEQRSTFRVVRAVAEVESLGFFDVYNAYDRGVMSAGPCHWTIHLIDSRTATNLNDVPELPALFAYLHSLGAEDAQAAVDVLERYGCGLDRPWPPGTSAEAAGRCWEPNNRKYVARVTLDAESGPGLVLDGREVLRARWFQQWQWCYRFAMGSRTNPTYRRRMWDLARLRIRDVLATVWDPQMATVVNGTPFLATVGDLFTSELAVALILRWHVNAPSNLLPLSAADRQRLNLGPVSALRQAFDNAGAANWGDPVTWGDAQETALIDELAILGKAAGANLRDTLNQVTAWGTPNWQAWRRTWGWSMTPRSVAELGVDGLATTRVAVDTPATVPFTVTSLLPPTAAPTVSAVSADQSVVANAGLQVAQVGAGWQLTVTPVAGASGATRLTVSAQAGSYQGSTEFTVRVGPPPRRSDPDPFTATELSRHRHSFQLAFADLP